MLLFSSVLRRLLRQQPWLWCAALACAQTGASAPAAADFLAGNTVLIVRHAEKPASGATLTPQGEARARAYALYFEPFRAEGLRFPVDALYAGADSANSIRPRLTLEPLSRATGLKIDTTVSTKDPAQLVQLLRSTPHGAHPLIAWRHGQIPALLTALGASPAVLPQGRWPDDTFDWVILLQFDPTGHLQTQQLIKEDLHIPQP